MLASEGLALFAPDADDAIEFVRIVRHDVFTPDDPYPDVFNVAHVVTAADVVARELLFAPGDRFATARLEESARNLRDIFIFSFVRVVPVVRTRAYDGPREATRHEIGIGVGAKGVLVFTRDLWSLRFEQGFQVTGASVDRLLLQLTERNVLGRAKVASVRFQMDPSIFAIGETYLDRRVWGGSILAQESVDVLFSRRTGAPEGLVAGVFVGMPLMNLAQPWGFDALVSFDSRVVRQIQDNAIIPYIPVDGGDADGALRVWRQQAIDVELSARRQFTTPLLASSVVHRFAIGVGFTDDSVAIVEESNVPKELEEQFARDVLPAVRRTLFPFAAYHAFGPRFRVYENLDTFGVSEAVRLGPTASVTMGAGARGALSSSDTVFATGAAGVALDPLDGLFEAAVEASARWEDDAVVNRVLGARLRYASPPVFLGRIVARADATFRRDDVTNALVSLGGNNGLRGYPSARFFAFGASSAQATVEWRTLPIDLWSVQLGGAAFYDAGALFSLDTRGGAGGVDTTSDPAFGLHHSIGVGVRFLFPQFNRTVYRLDFGVPLDASGFLVQFSLGDTQAVEHGQPAFDRLAPRR